MAKKPAAKAARSRPVIRVVTSKGKPSRVPLGLPASFPEPLQPGLVLTDMTSLKPVYYMVADVGRGWSGKSLDHNMTTLAVLNEAEVGRIAATRRRILKANGWL